VSIEEYPQEYIWAKSWQHLFKNVTNDDGKLHAFTIWIALRAQGTDYELFRPFLRRMMLKYPLSGIPCRTTNDATQPSTTPDLSQEKILTSGSSSESASASSSEPRNTSTSLLPLLDVAITPKTSKRSRPRR